MSISDIHPSEILFGKTRRAILSLLLSRADEAFCLRRIQRFTGAGLGAVQRELKLLTQAGIIRREEKDSLVYFKANRESPIFRELQKIIELSNTFAQPGSPEPLSRLISERVNVTKD